jgi:hypothetical protein
MRITQLLVVALAASQAGASTCGGEITRDPGFDLWCGEALCAWKLERGEAVRAPTWHAGDAGVELRALGAIEQFTPVDDADGTCIRFDLIADVDETAQVELGVDIYGDGTVERTFPIARDPWRPQAFRFAVAPPFTGIRFELAQRGPGHAVIARMRAQVIADGCAGLPVLDGGPAPLGARCEVADDCASAQCVDDFFGNGQCTGCSGAAPCTGGEVCGYAEPGPPERRVPIDCVDAGARVIGEQCLIDAECGSGICTSGVCSTCGPRRGCASCAQAYPNGPSLCSPGAGQAASGAPCASDSDCASGACTGPPRRQCTDGRRCASDASCPVGADLVPGPCSAVGVQGGSCR